MFQLHNHLTTSHDTKTWPKIQSGFGFPPLPTTHSHFFRSRIRSNVTDCICLLRLCSFLKNSPLDTLFFYDIDIFEKSRPGAKQRGTLLEFVFFSPQVKKFWQRYSLGDTVYFLSHHVSRHMPSFCQIIGGAEFDCLAKAVYIKWSTKLHRKTFSPSNSILTSYSQWGIIYRFLKTEINLELYWEDLFLVEGYQYMNSESLLHVMWDRANE